MLAPERPQEPVDTRHWAREQDMFGVIRRFLVDESGPTAVEYAVMLALILMSVIVGISTFGGQAVMLFGNSNTKMSAAGLGS